MRDCYFVLAIGSSALAVVAPLKVVKTVGTGLLGGIIEVQRC